MAHGYNMQENGLDILNVATRDNDKLLPLWCGAWGLSGHALTGVVCIGQGPEYRPFSDLRSVPQAGACTQVLFLRKVELGFLHFLEIVTSWLVPSAGQKISVQPGWYLPLQKIPLAEDRFLQTGKGAENTKEKSRAVLYVFVCNSFLERPCDGCR